MTDTFLSEWRHFFPNYSRLNAVQEKCFQRLYKSDRNVVISAPTGCGKTGCMDIALCRLFSMSKPHHAVYLAPTRALCMEREAEWMDRLSNLKKDVKSCTGDSDTLHQPSDVMYPDTHCNHTPTHVNNRIFTAEKLEAMTRRWTECKEIFKNVSLLLIDELHSVRCPQRGPCLEALIMRLRMFIPGLRIVAVSASIGNTIDFCKWYLPFKAC